MEISWFKVCLSKKFELRKSKASQGFQFHFTLFLISQNILKEQQQQKNFSVNMWDTPASSEMES